MCSRTNRDSLFLSQLYITLLCTEVKVAQSCRLFATPWAIQFVEFSRPEYWSGYPLPSPGDLPNPGIESRFPALRADSLSAEPQGKPKNTGVDSLSLLQWIFPIQESDQGLLHCRRILYQLSYQESPICTYIEWRKKEKYIIFQHNKILASFYERKNFKLYLMGLFS